ncbi:MAG: 30S ribosomal protein S4 [bacterium]
MKTNKCKICRRLGSKIFLKGDRCSSPKCAMLKRPFAPGPKKKRKTKGLSEYGKELREKQKLRNWYNLEEKQFRAYVTSVLGKRKGGTEDAGDMLIKILESRLDNIIFRFGLAISRPLSRQLVSHGHFMVNNRLVNIPSYLTKKGDKIKIALTSTKRKYFEDLSEKMKKASIPAWLSFDSDKLEWQVMRSPLLDEVSPPAEITLIFEFYSK